MKPIRVGLVGLGHLGRWHAQKITSIEDFELVAIVDPVPHEEELGKYPHAKHYQNIEAVPEGALDALVISSPTPAHKDHLIFGMERELFIFCEKPLLSEQDDLKNLEKKLLSYPKAIQVGHIERFREFWNHSDIEFIRRDICTFRSERNAQYKDRSLETSVIFDVMIHDIDLTLDLFGEMPSSVRACGKKTVGKKIDFASATLIFSKGRKAVLSASRNHPFEKRHIVWESHKGSAVFNLVDNNCHYSYTDRPGEIHNIQGPKADLLMEEQKDFARVIREKSRPLVDIQAGIRSVKVALAIEEAIQDEKEVQTK